MADNKLTFSGIFKEKLNRVINYSDGEDWLARILLIGVALLFLLVVRAITADHSVRCHYLETYSLYGVPVHAIKGDIDWGEDKIIVAFSDLEQSQLELAKLKQCAVA
jgi:hypothetical protein